MGNLLTSFGTYCRWKAILFAHGFGKAFQQSAILLTCSGRVTAYRQLPFSKQHRAGQKLHCARRRIAPGDNNVGNTLPSGADCPGVRLIACLDKFRRFGLTTSEARVHSSH